MIALVMALDLEHPSLPIFVTDTIGENYVWQLLYHSRSRCVHQVQGILVIRFPKLILGRESVSCERNPAYES